MKAVLVGQIDQWFVQVLGSAQGGLIGGPLLLSALFGWDGSWHLQFVDLLLVLVA